jgi:uncharacterized membrane protein YbhN (UPF0104 family)
MRQPFGKVEAKDAARWSWLRRYWRPRLALSWAVGVGFLFASVYLVAHAREASQEFRRIDWGLLALSFLVLLVTFGWQAWVWQFILKRLGCPVAYNRVYRIVYLSGLGAYVPGRIWQALGVLALGKQEAIPTRISGVTLVLANGLNLTAGSLFALICYLLTWDRSVSTNVRGLLLVIGVGLILTHPRLIETATNWALGRMKREPIQLMLRWRDTLIFVSLYIIGWVFYGSAFALLVRAVIQEPVFLLQVMGANAVAYVLGFVAVFAPGGIGVREATLSGLLAQVMPLELAAAIAVIARFWFVGGQLVCALLALIGIGRRRGSVENIDGSRV